jgi:hypothetical protein
MSKCFMGNSLLPVKGRYLSLVGPRMPGKVETARIEPFGRVHRRFNEC